MRCISIAFFAYILLVIKLKLTRKNLIILLIVCLILCLFFMYEDNQYNNQNLKQTIQTNGTPVSGHTIILDAGHGEPDRRCSLK